jgi:serine/threonine protein kinase
MDAAGIVGRKMTSPGPLEPPLERVGRYEIRSRIGQGGMAVVYRAALRGPVDATREVALKVIHPHLSVDEQFVLMFLDEMRLAMALSHRNIVQTFDAGEEDGVYFMVMELVEGCALHEMLRRVEEPLPLDIALFIALQVCSALEYAHTLDPPVTHRDVSPSNILISKIGDVKLADFGVAKAAGRIVVSSSNVLKGKVTYMSPEQARGHSGPPADIFALGAVLYEMISGSRIRPTSELEWIINNTAIPAILSEVRPEIPESLERLVMGCLANDVGQRPASATALHQSLNQELFQLLTSSGQAVDSHRRLRDFLEQRVLTEPTARAPLAQAREALLARKLIEAAASADQPSVASADDGNHQRVTVAAPGGPALVSDREPDAAPPPSALRPRAGWIIAVFVLAGALAVYLLLSRSGQGPRRNRPDATDQPGGGDHRTAGAVEATPDLGSPDLGLPPDLARALDAAPSARQRPPPRKATLWVLARIDGQVVWADVLIDGQAVGQSPVQVPRLRPGKHLIEARREGYTPAKRWVRLKPGQSLRVFIELVP